MKRTFDVGIMQGRLSSKEPANLQSFPWLSWREEFSRAAELGFKRIEWLVDAYDLEKNPLFHDDGRFIIEHSEKNRIQVRSVCAHFLIDGKLNSSPGSVAACEARESLIRLVNACDLAGIVTVVLPLMEKASLTVSGAPENLVNNLKGILDGTCCTLALETDLDAAESMNILDNLMDERIGLCFDIGNSVALGFDPLKEFSKLHRNVQEIHIKDRVVGGGSKRLGNGHVCLREFISVVLGTGYNGAFMLETPVGNDWEAEARHNFGVIEQLLTELDV